MLAVQYERGDVPAHHKNAHCYANNGGTDEIHFAKVFRRQEQGVRAKSAHKVAIDGAYYDDPEQK